MFLAGLQTVGVSNDAQRTLELFEQQVRALTALTEVNAIHS